MGNKGQLEAALISRIDKVSNLFFAFFHIAAKTNDGINVDTK